MASVSKELVVAPHLDSFATSRDSFPRSPASISPISSRRDSLRLSDRNSDPPTPNSPPMRMTRKRAASLNTDAANRIEELALGSSRLEGPQTAREQVCLCQPDPKIPRPRNGMYCAIPCAQHLSCSAVCSRSLLSLSQLGTCYGSMNSSKY